MKTETQAMIRIEDRDTGNDQDRRQRHRQWSGSKPHEDRNTSNDQDLSVQYIWSDGMTNIYTSGFWFKLPKLDITIVTTWCQQTRLFSVPLYGIYVLRVSLVNCFNQWEWWLIRVRGHLLHKQPNVIITTGRCYGTSVVTPK